MVGSVQENGRDKGGDLPNTRKKPRESVHGGRSNNILRNLMYRDFGIGTTNKASTRDFEVVAETNLVLKDHKELVGILTSTYFPSCSLQLLLICYEEHLKEDSSREVFEC